MLKLPDSWVWDFWLVRDPADAAYHVFFLYASRALHDPDRRHMRAGVGHAISTDLINWQRVSDALVHGEAGDFDETATWTGSVVQGPSGEWFMFYTGTSLHSDGTVVQQVGLATSPDLMLWRKHASNPLVTADSRWYQTLEADREAWHDEHWRDPWVFADPDGHGWHMLITARANHGAADDRGVIAHATSLDLIQWTVGPPLTDPEQGFGQLEVLQVEVVDGRPVLVFDCLAEHLGGARRRAGHQGGIWTAPADSLLGPFHLDRATLLVEKNLYVGKLVIDPAGRWNLMAFVDTDQSGKFVGELTDPIPVQWEQDRLVITHS